MIAAISMVSADCAQEAKTRAVSAILKEHGWIHHQQVKPVWGGFADKLHWAYECARTLTQYTHLAFFDARDIVVLAGPDKTLARFLEFGHPWVCGAEPFPWPADAYNLNTYPTCSTPYRFLNSGAYIAEREHMLACFDRWPEIQGDDQEWLTNRYLEGDDIILDHQCSLIQNMCGSESLVDISYHLVYNPTTQTLPLVIHYNGGANITRPDRRVLWDRSLQKVAHEAV